MANFSSKAALSNFWPLTCPMVVVFEKELPPLPTPSCNIKAIKATAIIVKIIHVPLSRIICFYVCYSKYS